MRRTFYLPYSPTGYMPEPQQLTISEAHRRFAIEANNTAWKLIEQAQRSSNENQNLLRAAHTSLYHWQQIGDGVHLQRGYCLLSHCYALLQQTEQARYHAEQCLRLTHSEKVELFDYAYCYETLSRVAALEGNDDDAHAYRQLALDIADEITADEDKRIFMLDFNRP